MSEPAFIALPGSRLGLLSDSHGDAEITRLAAAALVRAGADALLHLGDLGGHEGDAVVEALAMHTRDGVAIPARTILGNVDVYDGRALERTAAAVGVVIDADIAWYTMAGKRLAAHHGYDPRGERLALKSRVEYFFHGHTHTPRDERLGWTRVINPGALHRARPRTIALLDVARDELVTAPAPFEVWAHVGVRGV